MIRHIYIRTLDATLGTDDSEQFRKNTCLKVCHRVVSESVKLAAGSFVSMSGVIRDRQWSRGIKSNDLGDRYLRRFASDFCRSQQEKLPVSFSPRCGCTNFISCRSLLDPLQDVHVCARFYQEAPRTRLIMFGDPRIPPFVKYCAIDEDVRPRGCCPL